MVRRGAAVWLAVVLVTSLAPSAAGQHSLPSPLPTAHDVIAVPIPIGPSGSGSIQLPVAGGILDLRLDPILLVGPGGAADVQAYLAQATLLLPDGVSIPLPAMVVLAEDQAVAGPAAQALDDVLAHVAALQQTLDLLRSASQDEEPGPADGDDLERLRQDVDALVAEAGFVRALAEEAAGAYGPGAAEAAAIAGGYLARVEDALALIEQGLDGAAATAGRFVPEPESGSGTATQTGSPSPAPDEPIIPENPFIEGDPEAEIPALVAEAQAQVDEAMAAADFARDLLERLGGAGPWVADQLQEQFDEEVRPKVEGAFVALAQAQADLAAMREALQSEAAPVGAAAEDAAVAAFEDLEQVQGELQWAADWVAAARLYAEGSSEEGLADAARAIALAQGLLVVTMDLVERHVQPEDAPSDIAQKLDEVEEGLAPLIAQVQAGRDALGAALTSLGEAVGGMVPEEDPADINDDNGLSVCLRPAAQATVCFAYDSPVSGPIGHVTLLVALPVGPPLDISLPGSITSLTAGPPVPSPTGLPVPVPLPTGVPGLPGSSSSSSSSASSSSASASSSASGSASSSPASSSSGSSSAQGQPRLVMSADLDTLAMRMGEQASVVVTVRNDGDAADRVRVTAQTDAPIAFDSPTEVLDLAPGQQGMVTVRITPAEAGSGTLELLATGEQAGTVMDSVRVSVAAAADSAADIVASLEPSAVQGAVGQSIPVDVRVVNKGPVADRVVVLVSGAGVHASPERIEMLLQPAEMALHEVAITPLYPGALEVVLAISSEKGADLKPLLLLDAEGSMASSEDVADKADDPKAKDTPGLGFLAMGLAVLIVFVGIRRRLEK